MSVQQPILEHTQVHMLGTLLATIWERQHLLVLTLDPSQETTLDTIQVLETMQVTMPATLVERIQATSLVQQ